MSTVRAITKSQVDVLLEFASKDDLRAVICQNVLLDKTDEDKPVFAATDGRRLIVMDAPTVNADEYPQTSCAIADTGESAILPASFLKKAVDNLPKKTTVNALKFAPIIVGEKAGSSHTSRSRTIVSPLHTDSGETVVQETSFDGEFPNYKAVIPNTGDRTLYPVMLVLDAQLLAGTAKALAKHVKDSGGLYVQLYVPAKVGDPIVFKVPSRSWCLGTTVVFMPKRGENEYSDVERLRKTIASLVSLIVSGNISDEDKSTVARIAEEENIPLPDGFVTPPSKSSKND